MKNPIQFVSERTMAGAVAKDGSMALIEFVGGDHRFWLTVPVEGPQGIARPVRTTGSDGKRCQQGHRARMACGAPR
jgi:hypothetical protein